MAVLTLTILSFTGCVPDLATPAAATVTPSATSEATPTPAVAPTWTAPPPTPVPTQEAAPPIPLNAVSRRPQITMDIALNLRGRRLDVTQVVMTANGTSDPWQEVVFAVMPAHQPGVLALELVEVTTYTAGTTAGQRHIVAGTLDDMMLHVPMPKPVQPGDAVMITLVYHLRAPQIDQATWLPEGNLGAGERVLQAGDWHPTLVPYRDGAGWQTWTYHPVGDPIVYPVADYDVQIFADPAVVIAAPGEVTHEGGVHRYHLQGARSFAFLASPDYQVMVAEAGGLPLQAYYLPGQGAAAEAALEIAARAIPLYKELYGPYPAVQGEGAPALVIAQNTYWGSMEYAGLISLSDRVFQTHTDTPKSQLVSLTAHEIAHQWWYGAVGSDQVHAPWLDEAFAKYSELLYYERYHPELTRWWWETHVYRFDPKGTVDRTIYDFPSTPVYFNQLYGQAARFMADLRRDIGDDAFFAFVKAYRAAGESHAAGVGRLADADLFFTTLAAHTDVDLSPLLERYFTKPD